MKSETSYVPLKKYKVRIKWILPVFIISIMVSFGVYKYTKNLIYKNIYNTIIELSEQSVAQLNQSITNQMQFVETMAETINKGYFKTTQDVFNNYSKMIDNYKFTRLAIVDKKGNGITSDGFVINNYENVEEFFNHDGVYLSENRPSLVSNKQVNIYSKICYIDNELKVLCAIIETDDYKSILWRRLFNGKGGTYLINNNGTILIDSFDLINKNDVNLYAFMKDRYQLNKKETLKINNMAEGVKNKANGTFDIKRGNNTYFINYQKIGINDWYVVSIAPDDTIAKELTHFLLVFLGAGMILNAVIITVSLYIDLSNQNKNRKLYKTAYIDQITLLGNLQYFRENSKNYLDDKNENKYIISVDINKFKVFNNMYGYEFCNKILKELGKIIVKNMPKESMICRLYSDVFAVIFEYDKNIKTILDKISDDASNIPIEDKKINLNLSMGVYKIKKEDKNIDKIMNKVYIARCKMKGEYINGYYIFDKELENELLEEQKIESAMKSALKNNEFKIYYQPKYDSKNKKLIGAEALVRWYKDDTIIPPNKFIPLFEKNKFIVKLDIYIFEQVCKDMQSWKKKYGYVPKVSINVSKEHFVNPDFIKEYVKIADKYNVERNNIDLEITESATIDKNIDILEIMNMIKALGFTISIDDFGTGYSSLSMLQSMPIDIIKVDKVFVDKIDYNSNKNIINHIIIISKQLGVKTIVEGVETQEQFDFVKKLGCDMIQGYYFSKPLTKEEFEKKL